MTPLWNVRALRLTLAAVAACAVASVPALAATKSITVGDDFFIKRGGGTVSVTKGTTVKWVFKGRNKHNVVGSGAGRFINSGAPRTSGSYSVKASRKGSFKLICTVHGNRQSMTLKVR